MVGATIIDHGIDAGLAWHYGDPLREQRWLEDGTGVVELTNRQVVRIAGVDRRVLIGQDESPNSTGSTYWLSPQGQIIAHMAWVECADAIWGWSEPGHGLTDQLNQLDPGLDITVEARPDMVVSFSGQPGQIARSGTPDCLGGYELFLPRETPLTGRPVGIWALTARRIAAGVSRLGVDTDQNTLMGELLSYGTPRRLVRLHLDGCAERFLDPGTPLALADEPTTTVGFVGSMSYHYQLGPIALGLVDSAINNSSTLMADGVPAIIEQITRA